MGLECIFYKKIPAYTFYEKQMHIQLFFLKNLNTLRLPDKISYLLVNIPAKRYLNLSTTGSFLRRPRIETIPNGCLIIPSHSTKLFERNSFKWARCCWPCAEVSSLQQSPG